MSEGRGSLQGVLMTFPAFSEECSYSRGRGEPGGREWEKRGGAGCGERQEGAKWVRVGERQGVPCVGRGRGDFGCGISPAF